MKSAKKEAILALMVAAGDCPNRINQDDFWEYQRRIMEPLRETIRQLAAEESLNQAREVSESIRRIGDTFAAGHNPIQARQ